MTLEVRINEGTKKERHGDVTWSSVSVGEVRGMKEKDLHPKSLSIWKLYSYFRNIDSNIRCIDKWRNNDDTTIWKLYS